MMTKKDTSKKAMLVAVLPLVCACGILGCGRKEEPPVDPSSPESYMKDKAFLGKLEKYKANRAQIWARVTEAEQAYNEALKDDPNSELETTKALKAKLDATVKEYMDNRQKAIEETRARITPKPKRDAAGDAK